MTKLLAQAFARRDSLGVAVGVAAGLAVFYAVSAIVANILSPLIAVFIGRSNFELNAFDIGAVEFRYGTVIEYLLTLLLVVGVGYRCLAIGGYRFEVADQPRVCRECAMNIPQAARICPFCATTVVQSDGRGVN
jgi:large conductance mechanosensitive channel